MSGSINSQNLSGFIVFSCKIQYTLAMEITLSKRHIAAAIFIIIGVLFFVDGMKGYYNVKTAVSLENLTSTGVQKGRYVKGTVTEYAGFAPPGLARGKFRGVSVTFLGGFLQEIDFYTLKLKDGKYITLMTADSETKRALEGYNKGLGNSAYIEGEITSPVTELNYNWLQTALGKSSRKEVEELVSAQYAIKETDFSKREMGMFYGLGCVLTAAILFFSDRRLKTGTEEKE